MMIGVESLSSCINKCFLVINLSFLNLGCISKWNTVLSVTCTTGARGIMKPNITNFTIESKPKLGLSAKTLQLAKTSLQNTIFNTQTCLQTISAFIDTLTKTNKKSSSSQDTDPSKSK